MDTSNITPKEEEVKDGSAQGAGAARIERIIRQGTPEHLEYLKARFSKGTGYSFEFEGHRWAYAHSSFDDAGDFCVIWRPAPAPAPEVKANHTGEGPRREFASDAVWEEQVKAEFLSALDSLLLRFGAELGVEINGNACADIEATLSEYVTVGGEPSYFYCTLDLGSCYMPPRAERSA